MARADEAAARRGKETLAGTGVGNRGGKHPKDDDRPKKSSQAAGKDPNRGEHLK